MKSRAEQIEKKAIHFWTLYDITKYLGTLKMKAIKILLKIDQTLGFYLAY